MGTLFQPNGDRPLRAQQEVGFIETFATAADRRTALKELIPGTEDYFYYHCLHYQNNNELAEAQSMLDQWKSRFGENERNGRMTARQMLMSFDASPDVTVQYLRDRLGLSLDHAPPSRDRAAALSSVLNAEQLSPERLIESAISRDRSLSQLNARVLPSLAGRKMPPDQLRAWLARLDRSDIPGLVPRIAEELAR